MSRERKRGQTQQKGRSGPQIPPGQQPQPSSFRRARDACRSSRRLTPPRTTSAPPLFSLAPPNPRLVPSGPVRSTHSPASDPHRAFSPPAPPLAQPCLLLAPPFPPRPRPIALAPASRPSFWQVLEQSSRKARTLGWHRRRVLL